MLKHINSDSFIQAFVAIQMKSFEIFKLLSEVSEIDLSVFDNYLLQVALECRSEEIVKFILDFSTAGPAENHVQFIYVCKNSSTDMAKVFLAHPNVDPAIDDFGAIRASTKYDGEDTSTTSLLKQDPRCSGWRIILCERCKKLSCDIFCNLYSRNKRRYL
jgi:hypothetical protein